jgi:hypothetical protein
MKITKAQLREMVRQQIEERCQKGYKTDEKRKTKKMYGKTYRNCVKAESNVKEAQWGGFTGGAAPLDPDPVDSGPVPLGQLKQLFDILVDMGKPVKDILAMPEFVEVGVTSPEQLGESTLKERAAIPMEDIVRAEDIIKKHLEEMFDEIGRDGLPERFSLDALVEPIIQKYISARRSDRTPRFNKMTGRMNRR